MPRYDVNFGTDSGIILLAAVQLVNNLFDSTEQFETVAGILPSFAKLRVELVSRRRRAALFRILGGMQID